MEDHEELQQCRKRTKPEASEPDFEIYYNAMESVHMFLMCSYQGPGTVIDAGDTQYPRDAGEPRVRHTPHFQSLQGEK